MEIWTNRTDRFAEGSHVIGPGGDLIVLRSSVAASSAGRERRLVAFGGITTREQADTMRGAVLRAEAVDDEGVLWIHDLVGADVYTNAGEALGRVESVEANPASDLLVLGDGKLIPLTFVTGAAEGRLTVEVPQGLLDL